MPIRDTAVMDDFLDLTCESASWELALFDGDPMLDGVELTGNGYARVTIAPADWAAAADGQKGLTVPAQFPAPTDAWTEADYFALFRVGDGAMGDNAPLTEPLEVTGAAATGPLVSPVVFYDDSVEVGT
jgi:hypothetical protein